MFKSSIINNKTRSKEKKRRGLFVSNNSSSKNLKNIVTPFRYSRPRRADIKDISHISQQVKTLAREVRKKYRTRHYGKFSLFSHNTSDSFMKKGVAGKKQSLNRSNPKWGYKQRT